MFLIDIEKVNAQVGPDEALANTLIGMGTVFVVLVLISVIIFLLKFIPKLFERNKTAHTKEMQSVKPVEKKVPLVQVRNQTVENNTQIVAVLMAAIAAQMEEETGVPVSTDGLIIRSIKKRTFN